MTNNNLHTNKLSIINKLLRELNIKLYLENTEYCNNDFTLNFQSSSDFTKFVDIISDIRNKDDLEFYDIVHNEFKTRFNLMDHNLPVRDYVDDFEIEEYRRPIIKSDINCYISFNDKYFDIVVSKLQSFNNIDQQDNNNKENLTFEIVGDDDSL